MTKLFDDELGSLTVKHDPAAAFVALPATIKGENARSLRIVDGRASRSIEEVTRFCNRHRVGELGEQSREMLKIIQGESPDLAVKAEAILKSNSKLQNLLEVHLLQMEAYSEETYSHSLRVTSLAAKTVSSLMKYSSQPQVITPEDAAAFCIAATLHDYGKAYVPRHILHHPGKLTNDLQTIPMRRHVEYSAVMADAVLDKSNPQQKLIYEIIADHHESLNGLCGYPLGRSIDNDHVLSRLLPLVDRYDAMTSNRCYRKGMDHAKAISILQDEANEGIVDKKLLGHVKPIFHEWLQEQTTSKAVSAKPLNLGKISGIHSFRTSDLHR